MAKALEDIKVLDLTQWEAGPQCTLMMAFLGADVIKVEPPGVGDPARRFSTGPLEPNVDSFYFIYLNQNKKSITLNLEKLKGIEILKEMAKRVDVLVENFDPGTMEGWGLTYDILKEINPRLIYARITGYGSFGPYANYPCVDATAQAMASAMSLTGWPDKPPVKVGPRVGETGSGVNLFAGIMMAIHQRERTGKGQFVEAAMVDTVLNLVRTQMTSRQLETDQMFRGPQAKRVGVPNPTRAPSNYYPTKDPGAYILFVFGTAQHQWENLLRIIGHPELIGDPRFADQFVRAKYSAVVDKLITDWTSTKSGLEAWHAFASGGVSAGVTLTTTQVMNDPSFTSGRKVVEMEHPIRGKYKAISYAPSLEKSPVEVRNAPLLGQDNEKVYADILGYTREDLAKLKEVGVV